jgi:GxxExxY protein
MLRMALVTVDSANTVIGCAIAVHRVLGPGLFESVYEPCLAYELHRAGLRFERQVLLPLVYEGVRLSQAFRADFIVEDELLVEVKSVERLQPVHQMQVLTYVKLAGLTKGLLINFNVPLLKEGVRSIVRT